MLLRVLDELRQITDQFPQQIAIQMISNHTDCFQLTYADIQSRAEAFAKQLSALNIGPRQRLLIISSNHPTNIIPILGAWLNDCVPVPVDCSKGPRFWASIQEKIKASAMAISADRLEEARQQPSLAELPQINHQQTSRCHHNSPTIAPQQVAEQPESDMAFIVIGTGTTGKNKPIVISHQSVDASLQWIVNTTQFTHKERFYCPLPYHHIYPLISAYLFCLTQRITLTISEKLTLHSIKQDIVFAQASILHFVPPLLNRFHKRIETRLADLPPWKRRLANRLANWNDQLRIKRSINLGPWLFPQVHQPLGDNLKYITSGGAKLNPKTIKTLQSFGLSIIEGYGLSETCGFSAYCKNPLTRFMSNRTPHSSFHTTRSDKKEPAELYYQGPQRSPGYYEGPSITYQTDSKAPLATGDIGYIKDGQVEITGRKKEMILSAGGKNISPDDVESQYETIKNQVDELVVFGMPQGDNEQIHAAVVLGDTSFTATELIEKASELTQTMPSDFIIKQFHFVDSLPKANGFKVQRLKLAEWVQNQAPDHPTQPASSPKSPTEKKLVAIWQQVLPTEGWVNEASTSFYAMGGDSLMLSEILTKVSEKFNIDAVTACPFEQFIREPTLHQQARLIDAYLAQHPPRTRATPKSTQRIILAPRWQRILGGIYQGAILFLLPLLLFSCLCPIIWLGNTLGSLIGNPVWWLAPFGILAWFALSLLLTAGIKWAVIGRYCEGSYPLYGFYYYRWWTVSAAFRLVRHFFLPIWILLQETNLITHWYRLLGARIGENCCIDSLRWQEWDLITVGSNTQIAGEVTLVTAELRAGNLHLAPINIGNNVHGEYQSTVQGGVTIQDNRHIQANQSVNLQTDLPPSLSTPRPPKTQPYQSAQCAGVLIALYFIAGCVWASLKLLTPWVGSDALLITLTVVLTIITGLLTAAALKWIVLGKVKPKVYARYGAYTLKHWWICRLISTLHFPLRLLAGLPLHNAYLRLLGITLGKNVVIGFGNNVLTQFDLLSIGDNSFVSVSQFNTVESTANGELKQSPITLGKNAYVLNGACLQAGTIIENNAGISANAVALPHSVIKSKHTVTNGKQTPVGPDPLSHARPSVKQHKRWRRLSHGRIAILLLVLWFSTQAAIYIGTLLSIPLSIRLAIIYWIIKILLTVLWWLFAPKGVEGSHRLWQSVIQKQYLLTMPLSGLMIHYVFTDLVATPFYNAILKLKGAKIGQGTIINSPLLCEPQEMLRVGKGVCINEGARLTTHMLSGHAYARYTNQWIQISDFATIGQNCLLLPTCDIANYFSLPAGSAPSYGKIQP